MTLNSTFAQLIKDCQSGNSILPSGCAHGTNAKASDIQTILQVIFLTIGALAVLLIVIAGLRYITAAGEPAKVAQAKSAIVHALIGLVLAASAAVIVNFVIGRL